jgi:hypothetical protein
VFISHVDGTKVLLENDNWALLRFSGTEPVLRLMVEADSPDKAQEMISWLKQFCSSANQGSDEKDRFTLQFENTQDPPVSIIGERSAEGLTMKMEYVIERPDILFMD